MKPIISAQDFAAIDVRVGRIITVSTIPEAHHPAYKLIIDFGPLIGHKRSSARVTVRHSMEDLTGRLVAAAVNLPVRQIGPVASEVLVLGFPDSDGHAVLIQPDDSIPLGAALF